MTNGPSGDRVDAAARVDEIRERYGPGHTVTRFVEVGRPELLAAVERVEARLAVSESVGSDR